MKKKDIKKFAKKIANLETIIQNSTDNDEIHMAMNEILTLSGNIKSIVDLYKSFSKKPTASFDFMVYSSYP